MTITAKRLAEIVNGALDTTPEEEAELDEMVKLVGIATRELATAMRTFGDTMGKLSELGQRALGDPVIQQLIDRQMERRLHQS